MKKLASIFLVLLILCSCSKSELTYESFPYEASSTSQSQIISSAPHSGAEAPTSSEVPIDVRPTESSFSVNLEVMQDFDMGYFVTLPLSFKFTPPDERFLASFEMAFQENYDYLRDRNNFYEIGDYLLFSKSDSIVGPSQIMTATPDGGRTEVFAATQPIESIYIHSEHELGIELISSLGGNGEYYYSSYYLLDLLKGELSPFSEQMESKYGQRHEIYDGVLLIQHFPSLDPSYKTDIYRVDERKELLILSGTQSPFYANGRIYYQRDDALYSADFEGGETRILTDITFWQILDGKLLFLYHDQLYLMDLRNHAKTIINLKEYMDLLFADKKGIYFRDENMNLKLYTYAGETKRIIDDFSFDNIYFVGEWIYYLDTVLDHANDYYANHYWRIKTDGSGLKELIS